jgi:flagellar protein FliO/FliZ
MGFPYGSVLGFIAVIAMIPVALWLLKRTPLGAAAGQGPMKLVAVLPLAPNQRLLTVEVGSGDERRWLVLGATPAGITTLHSMAPGAAPAPGGQGLPPFAAWLQRARGEAHAPAQEDGRGH